MRTRELFLGITLILASSLTSSLPAQEHLVVPNSRLGTRIAPVLLLTRPEVQSDLGLTAAQVAEVNQISQKLYNQARKLFQQRSQATVEARRAIDQEQEEWLKTRLTEAQKKRLLQLDLQWEGPASVITRPRLSAALGLTEEQRTILTRIVTEFAQKRKTNPQQYLREGEVSRQILAVLSAPQRELWREMLGAPFRFEVVAGGPKGQAGAEEKAKR